MALGTTRVGAAASAIAAAANSRVASGGRSVASSRSEIESLNLSGNIGVNDESLLRFQDDGQLNPDGKRRRDDQSPRFSPPFSRSSFFALSMETENEPGNTASRPLFLTDLIRGIGAYEANIRTTSPSAIKAGVTVNYLF